MPLASGGVDPDVVANDGVDTLRNVERIMVVLFAVVARLIVLLLRINP